MNKIFRGFAEQVSITAGSPWAFVVAVGVLVVWALSGPFFGFSEQWQLIINSFTTIVTFLVWRLSDLLSTNAPRGIGVGPAKWSSSL